ncbi:MAG: Asp-tRNA(Asn)/Glu-tRNA(Gln) amidotransferase subunit GatA [bacterium]|nr:Asp-tRNA(Asn)/Glu-tRNA(Gln) amidotransferase subunit GatA [bacterium]
MSQELNNLTIAEAREGLSQKKFSSRELVEACFAEIHKREPELHAFLEPFFHTKHQAEEKEFNEGALSGIPFAIKDNILIKGQVASAGSKILENYKASYDATVTKKMWDAGALFIGRTNMDEFAMGSSTENSAYGPTKNPYDVSRVPGGSSGGSAAAVASGMCLGALGSDTGGSIRQPASFCGVVGLKPTYGAVSRLGLIAMASSLDVIGPITKTVEDAEILFNVIRGRDSFDSTTADSRITNKELGIKGLKIGVPKEYFGEGLHPEVKKVIESAIKKMEEAGAIIKEISLPHSKYALEVYYIIMPAEVSANLARFDGIRYGSSVATSYKLQATSLYDVYAKTRAEGFGHEVKRRVMLGTYTLSHGYYDAYYLKAQKVRRLIRDDFVKAFEEVDIIAGPTTPDVAFRFGEKANDPVSMYLSDIYTVAINLAGLPALSMPAGFVERDGKKLPVGLQLVGKWFEEDVILSIGKELEEIL